MSKNVTEKIINNHLVEGEMISGREIGIKIDQTLTQDATGTMVCLEFETLDMPSVQTETSVSYVDHNTLQVGFENADDHLFLKSFAKKYGLYYSAPGNGICHQVHLQRFAIPGKSLLGSDSHTPTCGAMGMLAIGTGGLNVALALAGNPFYLTMPEVVNIELHGSLNTGVAAKDIILEVLRQLDVKGGMGKVIEYSGPGLANLSIPERSTITNMGAELGATTSIFPSDQITYDFMKGQERENDWRELKADDNAQYEQKIIINLEELEPMVAKPHSPGNVVKAKDLESIKVDQVYIGSCTNSSYSDLAKAAAILEGNLVHPDVSLVVSPGSRQVLQMLERDGILNKFVTAGARILECTCGPCVGVGQAPPSGGITLRTSNRNFKGRSGTADAKIYLSSPETAAFTALNGHITAAEQMAELNEIKEPENYIVDDRMIIPPADKEENFEIRRGPNIKALPLKDKLPDSLKENVLLKVGDNITTDDIMPAGAKILALRSNIEAISQFVFNGIDSDFAKKALASNGGVIIGGENYGQGSSREHAAIAPMYLGVKAVIAKSFSRIHYNNLINFGILPLHFKDSSLFNKIEQDDIIKFENLRQSVKEGLVIAKNLTKDFKFECKLTLSKRNLEAILAGGLLKSIKNKLKNNN